jgi:uncharacterized membrane protein YkvI
MGNDSSWFQRLLLPGFAFKAVVIGGGYATGRELAEFFLPSGPWFGVAAMLLATALWSAICVLTFLFAVETRTFDYLSFFKELLGRLAPVFELAYLPFVILTLAVFGAAAGAIGEATLGLPKIVGSIALVLGIAGFTTYGNESVERLFKWVTVILYVTYAVFLVLALTRFGERIPAAFSHPVAASGWALGGTTYAAYNVVGAIVILPVLRHLRGRRDAVFAGLVAGPLTMIPAVIFFVCMCAFLPGIQNESLPSDYLLRQMNVPLFHLMFQAMIFCALLESGTGAVHAVNERIATVFHTRFRRALPVTARLTIAVAILVGSVFLAERFGLVALIAKGYRALAYLMLAIFVLPVLTIGLWRVLKSKPAGSQDERRGAVAN